MELDDNHENVNVNVARRTMMVAKKPQASLVVTYLRCEASSCQLGKYISQSMAQARLPTHIQLAPTNTRTSWSAVSATRNIILGYSILFEEAWQPPIPFPEEFATQLCWNLEFLFLFIYRIMHVLSTLNTILTTQNSPRRLDSLTHHP